MSDEFSETCPSTQGQKVLGAALVEEMLAMGIQDAYMDEDGYVYGTVPGDPRLPTIGLIAHMDTSPDASGENIKARVVAYEGGDICLNEEKGIYLCPSDYESLNNHIGKHLIVTDGTTLLGADDKAGIAEIVSAIAYLQAHPEIEHGKIRIGFNPDEEIGLGAQFGGKYYVHDVRVIRAPRHAASCPVAIGVSCSADRNIKAKITPEGIFLEKLEKNPARFLPAQAPAMSPAVDIDLDEGMDKVREILSKYPIKTRLNLKGTLVVARDIAHARIKQMLDEGKPMPEYFKKHPVYYAGPAKTPAGMASGSFGPTTAGRMDSYVDLFQKAGGSMVMVAKGNRSQQVTDACKANGGFYLGSIGGPAAILAKNSIKSVEVVDFEELGMEAVRKIYVENFPAFIIVDDKGNDFFADYAH